MSFSLNRNDSELIKIGLTKTRTKSYGPNKIVTERDFRPLLPSGGHYTIQDF